MKLFNWFVDLMSGFGMNKVNTLCDWVAYQEEEPTSLKKYQKY